MVYSSLFLICKNEQKFLDETIRFYLSIGIDKIYFVDNNNNDEQEKIIYQINDSKITYLRTNEKLNNNFHFQNEYINNFKNQSRWTLFFDRDEILNLKNYKTINEILELHEQYDCLFFNWKTFAEPFSLTENIDKSLLLNCTKREKIKIEPTISDHVKFIAKNNLLNSINNPHYPLINSSKLFNITLQQECGLSSTMKIRDEKCYDNPSLHHYFYNGIENFKIKMFKPDRCDTLFKECNYDYNIWYEKSYDLHFGNPYEFINDNSIIQFIKKEKLNDKIYPT